MVKLMIKLICLILFFTNFSFAEKNYKLVNEILFETSVQPISTYDEQNFKTVYTDQLASQNSLDLNKKLFKSSEEEFLFIYLVLLEAEDVDVDTDPVFIKKLNQKIDRSQFSKQKNKEIDLWIQRFSRGVSHFNLKKTQHESREAIIAWYESLQRKFNLQVKSNEFRNKIQFK